MTKLLSGEPTKDIEREYTGELVEPNPEISRLKILSEQFLQIVQEKRAELFDDWLDKVKPSEITELKNRVKGSLGNEAAVRNALLSEW